MKAILLICKPGSRFHFGEYAPDSDTALSRTSLVLHSDTLFAAFVNIYKDIFGDATELVSAFENGAISMSSAFFCLQKNEEIIWFLPKPASFDAFDFNGKGKAQKKIQFLSYGLWKKIENPPVLVHNRQIAIIQNSFACLKSELLPNLDTSFKVYHKDITTKVQVRLPVKEDNLYQLNTVEIPEPVATETRIQTHYYFLMNDEILDSRIRHNLDMVLKVFIHHGAGGERSQMGHFEDYKIIEDWIPPINDGDYACCLSILSPLETDMNNLTFYHTMFRGGRRLGSDEQSADAKVNGPTHLKSLRVIKEGAILKKDAKGDIRDISLSNDKSFLRYGKAFTIPVKNTWINEAEGL